MDDLSFLQGISFVDSFFPSGGYAHSFGIETAVHQGVIKNGKDLENYLVHWLREGVLRSDGIAVSIANQSIGLQDFDAIVEADQQLQAMKTAQEVREASRQMGRQVIRIGRERLDNRLIRRAHFLVENGRMAGHHAIAMGMVLGACEWSSRMAVATYLYQNITGWVSASLRLLPMGQVEGQKILHALMPFAVKGASEVEGLGLEDMTAWMALHEIRMMRHTHLEVRLFRS